MTLLEMSVYYAANAATLRARIVELRAAEQAQQDKEAAYHLHRRVLALMPLWQEARDLAKLTAHYYDRSTYKHEKYQL